MAERIDILLIEDNPGDRQLIIQEFKNFPGNFNFTTKEDGEDALNYIDHILDSDKPAKFPHLIILDLNLPRASGIEVLSAYKKHARLVNIPIVVFSSSSSQKDVESAYRNHANCYITKPFNYDDFSEAIRSIHDFWFNISMLPKTV
jgi:two-component system, chemotaxis family, response regulator Rcp1